MNTEIIQMQDISFDNIEDSALLLMMQERNDEPLLPVNSALEILRKIV